MVAEVNAPDLLLWVGSGFYPTIDDYVREAMNLGCAKRIARLPEDIVPGKSRCWLAHDEGKKGQGVIFAFFVIQGVELILDEEEKIEKYREAHADLNIRAVSSAQAYSEPPRRCGQRVYGGAYLVSEPDMDKVWRAAEPLAGKADITGGLVVLLHRIPFPRFRWRGWRYMDPALLAKHYDWPQRSLPSHKKIRLEPKGRPKKSRKGQRSLFDA